MKKRIFKGITNTSLLIFAFLMIQASLNDTFAHGPEFHGTSRNPEEEARSSTYGEQDSQWDERWYECPKGDFISHKPGRCPKCGKVLEPEL